MLPMETAVLLAFGFELVICIAAGVPTWIGLAVGLVLFLAYGLIKGHGLLDLLRMCGDGIATARGILIAFIFIGALTALWRASGTVAEIVLLTSPLVSTAMAPLATFLLTAGMSFLIGTSFGTAATMGVVCMTLARSLGADPLVIGGAILSGAYFGDRISPLSTSALLVRTVTDTDMTGNMRGMVRTALVPFVAAVAAYAVWGRLTAGAVPVSVGTGMLDGLSGYFGRNLIALLPALLVLVLPLFKVSVKGSMLASIVAAAAVCVSVHGATPAELVRWAIAGFACSDASVGALMDGGGILSMVNIGVIVCLSSSYAGIFEGTGLLCGVRQHIAGLARRITPYGAVLAVSIPTSMVACNQTLGIMLAHQLCQGVEPDSRSLALDLEDTAVVVSPLVPWSIACTAVASMCTAPATCFLAAVYLWLIPLWRLAQALFLRRDGDVPETVSRLSRGFRGAISR